MKKLYSKVLAVSLAALMLTGGTFVQEGIKVSADSGLLSSVTEENKCGDNVTYSFDDTTGIMIISGTGDMYDYAPDESPFRSIKNLKSIIIEKGVTSVGEFAFYECDTIERVQIQGTKVIKQGAFEDCSCMVSVTMTNGVETICDAAFYACTELKNVKLPDTVTYLGVGAFAECINLESIDLSDNLKTIATSCFEDCGMLDNVVIPESIEEICNYAFYRCLSLRNMTFPKKVFTIADAVMKGVPYYDEQEDGIVYLGYIAYAFKGEPIADIVFKEDTLVIGKCLLEECGWLNTVQIPDSVEYIDSAAFVGCVNLHDLKLPANLKAVGYGAFARCDSLEELEIPEGVVELEYAAFGACGRLKSVKLPETLEIVNATTFLACPELKEVTLPKGIKEIGEDAFGCLLTDIDFTNNTLITEAIPDFVLRGWNDVAKNYAEETGLKYVDMNSIDWNVVGDVNRDGKVTTIDALNILQAVTGVTELTEEQQSFADVNGDGVITSEDALKVLQIVVGL